MIYLIGSLRNDNVPNIAEAIRAVGHEVFDDWFAAGPEADDYWRDYEQSRGHTYVEALDGHAANHVFEYDRSHLDRASAGVLVLPAGKSGHLEAGYLIGQGKPVFILLPENEYSLPPSWLWLTGVYEGEGSLTRNGRRNGHGMQLTVTMRDKDIIHRLCAVAGRGTVEGPYKRTNPKWSSMWRWSVRKRADILYVLHGMSGSLGVRRQEQVARVLREAGVTQEELEATPGPHERRFDVMYKFARGVYSDLDALLQVLKVTSLQPRLL